MQIQHYLYYVLPEGFIGLNPPPLLKFHFRFIPPFLNPPWTMEECVHGFQIFTFILTFLISKQ